MKKFVRKSDVKQSKEKKVFTVRIIIEYGVRIFSKEDERDAIPITEIFERDEDDIKI